MDKYVWHSVRDELPPSDAPMLILMVKHIVNIPGEGWLRESDAECPF